MQGKRKFKLKHFISYIVLFAALILFIVLDSVGVLRRSSLLLITQMSYSIILAVSLNLIVGFLGELSLGHAGFMCVGAYIGGFVANILYDAGMSSAILVFIISAIAGALSASVAGLIIGLPALRLKGDYLAIVTLAFGEIVRTIFKNLDVFGGAMGITTRKYGSDLFVVAMILVIFTVFVARNLIRSKHGRAIRAIRDNEIAARSVGVNVTYYKLMVFVIGAFFAGIAGVIYAHNTTPVNQSFFSFNYSIEILVMVVLGGMGSINGSIIAAAALTFINVQLTTQLSGDMAAIKNLIYALILIVVVMFNNAPALAGVREKVRLGRLIDRLFPSRLKPSETDNSDNGTAAWDKIPTKIEMDALLSTDIIPENTADSSEKDGD